MSDQERALNERKGASHVNDSDNEASDVGEEQQEVEEQEDEEAMQAALREMVQVPDIDPKQKQTPSRQPAEPRHIGNLIEKLKKTASPETQRKWLKTVTDVGIQAENTAVSKKSTPEHKPKKAEPSGERLKQTAMPSGTSTEPLPAEQQPRSDPLKKPEAGKQTTMPNYLQFKVKPERLEPTTPDEESKLERIEAASRPKSYFQIRDQAEAAIAAIATPAKEAHVAARPENVLEPSNHSTGAINILTGSFRRSLNVEPSDEEPSTTKALPEGKKTKLFRNLPLFGRGRAESSAVEKSTAEAQSQEKHPTQKATSGFFANLTSFKRNRPKPNEKLTESINITAPNQFVDEAMEATEVQSTPGVIGTQFSPVPSTGILDTGTTPVPSTGIIDTGTTPAPSIGIIDTGTSPVPSTGMIDEEATPIPSTGLIYEGSTPIPSTGLIDAGFTPVPSFGVIDAGSSPMPSNVVIDIGSTPVPSSSSIVQAEEDFYDLEEEGETEELIETDGSYVVTYQEPLFENGSTMPDFLNQSEETAERLSSSSINSEDSPTERASSQDEEMKSLMRADRVEGPKYPMTAEQGNQNIITDQTAGARAGQSINTIMSREPDLDTAAASLAATNQLIEVNEQQSTAIATEIEPSNTLTRTVKAITSATRQLEEPIINLIYNFPIYGRSRPTPIDSSPVSQETALPSTSEPVSVEQPPNLSRFGREKPTTNQVITETAHDPVIPLERSTPMPCEPNINILTAVPTDSALVSPANKDSIAQNQSSSSLRHLVPAMTCSGASHPGSSNFTEQPRASPVEDGSAVEGDIPSTSNSLASNILRYFFPADPKSPPQQDHVQQVAMQPLPNEVIIIPPQLLKDKDHKSQGRGKDNDKNKENEVEKDRDETAQSGHMKHSESMRTLTIIGRHSHITTTYRDHCHYERHDEGVDKIARRKLIIASALCLTFMICEIIGGILSRSLAIATDAAHLLTDLAGFLISLFALYLSARPSTQRMNFGWYRAEVIGAMLSVYFIWVITGVLVYMAIERLVTNKHDVDAKIMLITSALAIAFNIIMAIQLGHGHSHGHSHGTAQAHSHREPRLRLKPSETSTVPTGSRANIVSPVLKEQQQLLPLSVSAQCTRVDKENINVRAAYIHVIGDMIQSFGVFLAALIIFFKPTWAFVDSICTFIFSVIVLLVTFRILKDVLMVLMEATPDYMDYGEVQRTFLSIEGVEHVHNLRIWALSINKIALSAHLAISKDADPQVILEKATTLIHKRYNFFETTIQIEEYTPGMEDCNQCMTPQTKTAVNEAKGADDKDKPMDHNYAKDDDERRVPSKRSAAN
ncbi:flocculation protein FLO11 [Drosophila mojavensis]|uniref:Zinc transporter 2 n=1 Tax=Drosophila mojavensis TaxID=7230 RepID=A0A0Q9X3S1_DROMO|nr:flocculation protein FLO11 [Drosophila mojavensis]KRG02525.1 uncharacterized protein Dmoj_GI25803 [Drosophila mojavensis]